MAGVHQLQEQNERILTLLEEQRPAEDAAPGDPAPPAADQEAVEENDRAP